jgi:hypothetical protein
VRGNDLRFCRSVALVPTDRPLWHTPLLTTDQGHGEDETQREGETALQKDLNQQGSIRMASNICRITIYIYIAHGLQNMPKRERYCERSQPRRLR